MKSELPSLCIAEFSSLSMEYALGLDEIVANG
jgi:hypothetical protein